MEPPHGFYFPDSPFNWEETQRREALRIELFKMQGGLCFWCVDPMSLDRTRITEHGNVKFNTRFATFEHLRRKRDGGKLTRENTRLAHESCNRNRDRRSNHPRYAHDPEPITASERRRKPNKLVEVVPAT